MCDYLHPPKRDRYEKMSVRSSVASNKTAGAGTNRTRPTAPPKTSGAGMRRMHILTPRAGEHRNRPGAGFSLIQPAATAIAEAARRSETADNVGTKGQKPRKSVARETSAPKKRGGTTAAKRRARERSEKCGKAERGRVRNRRRERAASRRTAPDRTDPTATANPNTAPKAAKVPHATGRK